MSSKQEDQKWMRVALKLAQKAADLGEVPVGAVLVGPEGVLAQGFNQRETLTTPLGHAEAATLHRAAKRKKSWRLEDTTLYVTLEPCLMCAGALLQSRVKRVVYGAKDPKGGAVDSLYTTFADKRLNHQIEVTSGVLEKDCAALLQSFFQERRSEIKTERSQKNYRHRSSVVVLHKNKILGFHGVDPTSQKKYFFLPGGKIEEGETSEQAAVRETFEETGYRIRVLPNHILTRKYEFDWDGQLIPCETDFVIGVLDEKWHEPGQIDDAAYNKGAEWISAKEIDAFFGYHKDVLWGVRWGLKRLRSLNL